MIPGTMILLTVLSVNVFGDGLRDALDPSRRCGSRRTPALVEPEGDGRLMGRFVGRRLLAMIFVLFAISVIVFLIFNVIPNSDPAQRIAGKNATPELVASITEEWGFDEPLPQQYLTMMKKVFTGDLISYSGQDDVDQRIVEGIPATFSLCIGAAVIWMFFGMLFGYLSAIRAGGLARPGADDPRRGRDLGARLLAGRGPAHLPDLQDRTSSRRGGYVRLTEEPVEWVTHLILPWITLAVLYDRLLQPRAALQHARRDERGLRAHRTRQGAHRAPGDASATSCATR